MILFLTVIDQTAARLLGVDQLYISFRDLTLLAVQTTAAPLSILALALYYLRKAPAGPTSINATPARSASRILQSDAAFNKWIASDYVISNPEDDLFGHARVARRIATRILHSIKEGDPNQTQAIVGQRGTGKSTIVDLLAHLLDEDQTQINVAHVQVSLWPYESPDAAVRGILDAVIARVGEHASTMPIAGLPDEYVDVLESSPGLIHGVARHFRSITNPKDILKRIDSIATAIGMHIVLCVEDLERFAREESGTTTDTQARLSSVRSLLHMLDAMPSLSVVLASDSIEQRFDLEKIARHVERPPTPTPEEVWAIIRKCKVSCLALRPGMVDPSGRSSVLDSLDAPEDAGSLAAWLASLHVSKPTTQLALAHLLENPRLLKSALRSSIEGWRTLAGEIDRDDLLVVSALSTCCPGVVAFLDAHIEFMRADYGRTSHSTPFPGEEAARTSFEEQLTASIAKYEGGGTRQMASIRALVDFLFLPRSISPDLRPQGVAGGRHTDYWKRLMRGALLDGEIPDQHILSSISTWQADRSGDLPELMMTDFCCEAVENFEALLPPEEIPALARSVIASLKLRSTSEWQTSLSRGKHPASIVALTRMTKKRPCSEQLARMVHDVLPDLIRDHLPLANEVLYWFVEGDGSRSLLDDSEVETIRRLTETSLEESFGSGNAEQLRTSLRDGHAYTMLHAAYGIDRIRANEFLEAVPPFAAWSLVGSTLIALSEAHPDVGFPQLLPFITDGREGGGHVFREDRARALFDIDHLMSAIRTAPLIAFASGDIMSRWEAVRLASAT